MTTQEVKRKLTAILSADVKGYSRLMGEDEKGTVRTLNAYKEVMAGLIQDHHGRIVDAPGDNVLAGFASVVDAVECAVQIQEELKNRNAQLPESRRMEFRIGVNLVDVIEDGDQILGDGVNIAARLESLSEAGGICISGIVYDQIENRLLLGYEYLGEQTVKNIAKPVRVYRVLTEPGKSPEGNGKVKVKVRVWNRKYFATAAAVVVIIGTVVTQQFVWKPSHPKIAMASKDKMAYPLPDRPSIAVLPFVNMNNDPVQEFFSDGITEEVITTLSKSPYLLVIARSSTSKYKNRPVEVRRISEDLGVQYVLEGSVRRSEGKVRITAQFIDALKGHHLWAERFDREIKEILTVQDEIALKIMKALHVKLQAGQLGSETRRGAKNLEVFLKSMEARELVLRYTKEGNARARKLFEEVIALDPNYARGYSGLAISYAAEVWLGTSKSPKESFAQAIEFGQKAASLDESDATAQAVLAYLFAMARQYDKAVSQAARALALDSNSYSVINNCGLALAYSGKHGEALPLLEKAVRLNPSIAQSFVMSSMAYRIVGRYEDAFHQAKRAVELNPKSQLAQIALASTSILTRREEGAYAAAAEVLKINPMFSVERYGRALPFKDRSQIDLMTNALRKAGLE